MGIFLEQASESVLLGEEGGWREIQGSFEGSEGGEGDSSPANHYQLLLETPRGNLRQILIRTPSDANGSSSNPKPLSLKPKKLKGL